MKAAILFFVLLLLMCTACRRTEPALADLAAGQKALKDGDYATALKIFAAVGKAGKRACAV